jgi:lipoprotein-anchoring transpeptidase ErfK/SrfK
MKGERLVVLAREGRFAKVRIGTSRGPTVKRWVNEREGKPVTAIYSLIVRRKKRDVLVFREGRQISRIRATVGAPSTPTPSGVFTITERFRFKPGDREFSTYGCCVLALDVTVFAPFGGQTWGSIAIHRNFGGDLGRAVSHGCIRIPMNRLRRLYGRLTPGSLVKIV